MVNRDAVRAARHAPARVAILINNTYVADARAWKTAVSLGRAGYLDRGAHGHTADSHIR